MDRTDLFRAPELNLHRRRLLITPAGGVLAAVAALTDTACAASSEASAAPQDGTWRDNARQREVPWRLRLPTGAGASANSWPLVLYSHGLGGSREGGDAWGEAWRAAGIAVLHLQHPGSDTDSLRGGVQALRAAVSAEQLVARALDMRFAIDELARRSAAGEEPWVRHRADAIGIGGHSFGALTTQAVAGQRFPVPSALAEPRARAFIAFSPSTGRGRAAAMTPREAFGAITRPFLVVTGSLDGDPFGSHATGEPRAKVYEGLAEGQRALLWLEGADHMSFAGNAMQRLRSTALFKREPRAERAEPRHHALVAALTTLWWRAHLLGDAEARKALAAPAGLEAGDRFELG